jgi:hypothetical protein
VEQKAKGGESRREKKMTERAEGTNCEQWLGLACWLAAGWQRGGGRRIRKTVDWGESVGGRGIFRTQQVSRTLLGPAPMRCCRVQATSAGQPAEKLRGSKQVDY